MEHVHEHAHHPPILLYYKIFGALMVVLFFMQVKYESKLTKLFAVAGFIWLAILLAFTLQDTETRRHDPGPKGWALLPKNIVRPAPAHGSSHTSEHAAPIEAPEPSSAHH